MSDRDAFLPNEVLKVVNVGGLRVCFPSREFFSNILIAVAKLDPQIPIGDLIYSVADESGDRLGVGIFFDRLEASPAFSQIFKFEKVGTEPVQ